MAAQVSGATFTFGGATFTAPAAGSYRIGEFLRDAPGLRGEHLAGGRCRRRPDRDGDHTGTFAALWNDATGQVWW